MSKEIPTEKGGQALRISDVTLEDLLPHRDTMLLVEEIVEVDDVRALTRSRVSSTWPIAGDNGVSPLVLVELAAQTAGVCNGWKRVRRLGRDSDNSGLLVAVKKAEFYCENLQFGMVVTASSENTMDFDNFLEVTSRLFHGDELLADIVLQVYQA